MGENPSEGNAPTSARYSPQKTLGVSPEGFEAMLKDLGFFPDIVQIHSLKQHLHHSLTRHPHSLGQLTFSAFLECLCRIVFVYLSIYGNSVQLPAPSKSKCLWLIAMLRVRCRDFGQDLGLPTSLTGDPSKGENEGSLWRTREACVLDTMPLKRLFLWRALDADVASTGPSLSVFNSQHSQTGDMGSLGMLVRSRRASKTTTF